MTWLEILKALEEMPLHLLKKDAELWHYDDKGECDVLPVDSIVSPLSDDEDRDDPEWKMGGAYCLSFQSFDEKPKETFIIDVTTLLGQTFAIEADSIEDAEKKARELVNNRRFFDERLHAKWSYDGEWDATEVIQVVDGWDCHDMEEFIEPEIVDSYLNGE